MDDKRYVAVISLDVACSSEAEALAAAQAAADGVKGMGDLTNGEENRASVLADTVRTAGVGTYRAQADFYLWAKDDAVALASARVIANRIAARYGACELTELVEQKHGTLGNRPVFRA